jgi:SecD/SecF fusion protein
MSVDANVISFERMKEELTSGRSLKEAFNESYKHSLLTIFDANITTLVAAVVMFFLGESSVKGFATMLIISIFLTIIIIVYGTKYLLKLFIDTKYFNDNKHKYITIRKPKKKEKKIIDFLKYKNIAYITSIIIILLGFTLFFTRGLNLGIDYKGGSSITIVSKENLNISDVRKDIDTFGLKVSAIEVTKDKLNAYVKVEDMLDKDKISNISSYFDEKYNANTEIGVVSDMVKKELTMNAILAVLLSCIGIIIYVAFRFHFSYGVSSVIAVFHDALMVIAVFSICQLEVNVIFIAAILAIIGYSINDTIVIFDRIRENEKNIYKGKLKNKKEFYDLINLSVNETMKRTIYTSTTTVIVVTILILFGSYEILNFNIAMFIGLISGTYSTVFIACALLYQFEKNNIGKEKKKEIKDEIDEPRIKGVNC